MQDESPSNSVPKDVEGMSFVNAVAVNDESQDSPNAPPAYDSATPLPTGSPSGNDGDPEAQQTTGALKEDEDKSPPMSRQEKVQMVVIITLFFAAIEISPILDATGVDPLNFSRLAWYSTSCSVAISWLILVCRSLR
jgi:hypothetical protein